LKNKYPKKLAIKFHLFFHKEKWIFQPTYPYKNINLKDFKHLLITIILISKNKIISIFISFNNKVDNSCKYNLSKFIIQNARKNEKSYPHY